MPLWLPFSSSFVYTTLDNTAVNEVLRHVTTRQRCVIINNDAVVVVVNNAARFARILVLRLSKIAKQTG